MQDVENLVKRTNIYEIIIRKQNIHVNYTRSKLLGLFPTLGAGLLDLTSSLLLARNSFSSPGLLRVPECLNPESLECPTPEFAHQDGPAPEFPWSGHGFYGCLWCLRICERVAAARTSCLRHYESFPYEVPVELSSEILENYDGRTDGVRSACFEAHTSAPKDGTRAIPRLGGLSKMWPFLGAPLYNTDA